MAATHKDLEKFVAMAKPYSHWPDAYFRIRCLEYELIDGMFGDLFRRGGDRMLDFGCGIGLASVWMAQYFDHVDGCDLDELGDAFKGEQPSVRIGQDLIRSIELKNVTLYAGNTLEFLRQSHEKYNFIFSHFVLEHVPDLPPLCIAMYDALVPGGRSFHVVPNTHDTINQLLIQNLIPPEENRRVARYAAQNIPADGRYLRELANGWFAPVTHSEFISDYRDQFAVNSSEHYLFPMIEAGFRVRDMRPLREHAYGILLEKPV
jgi:2-polyprenyl-3-methyl-5-hydroxy-6-metoxy-1,4-benzoquinol methylase